MTDRDALLAAIRRNREEDVPRLMFADEIEATEPKRAELIRVQVELAKAPPCEWGVLRVCNRSDKFRCVSCGERFALQDRESGLFSDPHPVGDYRVYSNRLGWTEDIRQWAHDIEWDRGFVRKFACEWKDWADNAAAVLPDHPRLERVELTTPPVIDYRRVERDDDHYPARHLRLEARAAGMVAASDRVVTRSDIERSRAVDVIRASWEMLERDLSPDNLLKLWWGGDPKDGWWGVAFDLPRPDAHGGQYRHWRG